jgi:hypothetical protein
MSKQYLLKRIAKQGLLQHCHMAMHENAVTVLTGVLVSFASIAVGFLTVKKLLLN